MSIVSAILVIAVVIIIAGTVNLFGVGNTSYNISMREAMDFVGFPLVTFTNNGNKYNFIIDTGSNNSFVSSDAVESMNVIPIDDTNSVIAYSGESEAMNSVMVILGYKESKYHAKTIVSNHLTESFKQVKSNYGVQLHGILGCDFLEKYDYVIDFNTYQIHSKK